MKPKIHLKWATFSILSRKQGKYNPAALLLAAEAPYVRSTGIFKTLCTALLLTYISLI